MARCGVDGRRSSGQRDMTADQLIKRTDGSLSRIRGAGRSATRSRGHDHWDYLFFDRYELRRPSDHRLVRPQRPASASATATTRSARSRKSYRGR